MTVGGDQPLVHPRRSSACCPALDSTRSLYSAHPCTDNYHCMSATAAKNAVRVWLEQNRLGDYKYRIIEVLGVDAVEDLELVTEADLRSVGVKPVQAWRFLRVVGTLLPPKCTPTCSQKRPINQDYVDDCGSGDNSGKVHATVDCMDLQDYSEDDSVERSMRKSSKRYKTRLSLKQRASCSQANSEGVGRVVLPSVYNNGTARSATAMGDVGTRSKSGSTECSCMAVLKAYEGRFAVARRTAQEKKPLAESGSTKGSRCDYNYALLLVAVMEVLFDACGNWVVHEGCAGLFLGVSNWWMARCHTKAIWSAKAPVKPMSKSAIAASSNVDEIIARIKRPDDCLMSAAQYFQSSPMEALFDVVCSGAAHGLTGMPGNRTKLREREQFADFVLAHRSPTVGPLTRTAEATGGLLPEAKWVVLRPRSEADTRPSFAASFNQALVASGRQPFHLDVPLRWLRELFGSKTRVGGSHQPSDDHTVLCPHKTDACAMCENLRENFRQSQQSLERHRQQSDQASLVRHDAIEGTCTLIKDLERALGDHKSEASQSITYYKHSISGAYERYKDLVDMYKAVISSPQTTTCPTELLSRRSSSARQAAPDGLRPLRTTSRIRQCRREACPRSRDKRISCRASPTTCTSSVQRAAGTRAV
eukprot:TRINITY_DN6567_c0_g1_i8.p1 TRINITY_DN6567_c0_g1~~TRINITY_DN6567_c0_g1_i8.p1  ORF type:complete len:647 (-),score=61.99 TRINITY_DN6567_c0_g1_i8:223-2163(-)